MAKAADDRSVVKTLQKGLEILDVVADAHRPLSVSEIAEAYDMDIGTVHRFLNTFVQKRYLAQDPHTKQYVLGAKVLGLSRMFYQQHRIYDLSRSELIELSGVCEETVMLSVISAIPTAIVVDHIKGSDAAAVALDIGMQLPLYCTAAGKAMLAMHEREVQERILDRIDWQRHAQHTVLKKKAVLAELARVAEQGYAEEHNEFSDGINAIAAPILNLHRQPVAALSVVYPSFRFQEAKMRKDLRHVLSLARSISHKLGYEQNADSA